MISFINIILNLPFSAIPSIFPSIIIVVHKLFLVALSSPLFNRFSYEFNFVLSNTSSFPTQWVRVIFRVFLQRLVSKPSIFHLSASCIVKRCVFHTPYTSMAFYLIPSGVKNVFSFTMFLYILFPGGREFINSRLQFFLVFAITHATRLCIAQQICAPLSNRVIGTQTLSQ